MFVYLLLQLLVLLLLQCSINIKISINIRVKSLSKLNSLNLFYSTVVFQNWYLLIFLGYHWIMTFYLTFIVNIWKNSMKKNKAKNGVPLSYMEFKIFQYVMHTCEFEINDKNIISLLNYFIPCLDCIFIIINSIWSYKADIFINLKYDLNNIKCSLIYLFFWLKLESLNHCTVSWGVWIMALRL